jgi:hypothetical protein
MAAPISATAKAATLTGDTARPATSLFAAGESVTLSFRVKGLAALQKPISLLLDIDDEHDNVIEHKDITLAPDDQGNCDVTVDAPARRLGFYRVYAKLSDGTLMAKLGSRQAGYMTYAVVPDPNLRKSYSQDVTRFGMQGAFSPATIGALPYLGVRWILGGFGWGSNEPNHAGEYADLITASRAAGGTLPGKRADGLKMPSGEPWRVYTLPSLHGVPKWAASPESKTRERPLNPAGEAAFLLYAEQAARVNRELYPTDPNHVFEVTWEPDYPWGWDSTNERLLRLYELAYPALHRGDPNVIVVGPTLSNISTQATYSQTSDLFAKGLGKYIDAYSVHGYFPVPPEASNMREKIRALAAMTDELAGRHLRRICSEQGCQTHEERSKELEQAQGLTRQNLIMLGEGYWFNFAFYFCDFSNEPGYGYFYNLDPKTQFGSPKVAPKPVASVYAAQSLLLDGSTSAGAIDWLGPTTTGYAFERGGEVTLALWDYSGVNRTVDVPVGANSVSVYDWMGNPAPLATPNGTALLTVGPEPIYVVGASLKIWGIGAAKPIAIVDTDVKAIVGATAHVLVKVSDKNVATVDLQPDRRISTATISASPARDLRRPVDLLLPIPPDCAAGLFTCVVTARDRQGHVIGGDSVRMAVDAPVAVATIRPAFGVSGTTLEVAVRSSLDKPADGTLELRLDGVPDSKITSAFVVAAREVATLNVPINTADLSPGKSYQVTSTTRVSTGYTSRQSFRLDFLNASRVPLGFEAGDSDAWKAVATVPIAGHDMLVRSPKLYRGDADLAAEAQLAWNDTALFLRVIVADDIFVQDNTGFSTWKGDCLQVGFDMDPDLITTATGNLVADKATRHRSSEVSLALTSSGPQIYRTASYDPGALPVGPVTAPLTVIRTGTLTTYTVALPWSVLGRSTPPKSGERLGFAMTVNDMDTSDQPDPKALGLFGGIAGTKSIAEYGILTLAK